MIIAVVLRYFLSMAQQTVRDSPAFKSIIKQEIDGGNDRKDYGFNATYPSPPLDVSHIYISFSQSSSEVARVKARVA